MVSSKDGNSKRDISERWSNIWSVWTHWENTLTTFTSGRKISDKCREKAKVSYLAQGKQNLSNHGSTVL